MARKGRYLLRRDVNKEARKVSAAASKRGSWAKIGAGLGGLLAIGLTGGAAAPLVAAGMAGMGTYLGGKAGAALSGTKKDLTGGRFLHGSKEEVKDVIEKQTQKSAITSFATAGMTRFMGGSPLDKIKEGTSYSTKGGFSFDFGKMFGKGKDAVGGVAKEGVGKSFKDALTFKPDASQVHEYGDSLFGKIGKTLDIKDSFIGSRVGEGVNKLGSMIDARKLRNLQTGEGLVSTGQGDMVGTGKLPRGKGGVPDLDKLFEEEMQSSATGGFLDQDVYRAQANQAGNISPMEIRGSAQTGGYFDSIAKAPETPIMTGLDKLSDQGMRKGWLQSQTPVKTVGSNDFYSKSFGDTSQASSSNKRWW